MSYPTTIGQAPLMGAFIRKWLPYYDGQGVGMWGWQLHCPDGGILHRLYMGRLRDEARDSVRELNERRRANGLPQVYCEKFFV